MTTRMDAGTITWFRAEPHTRATTAAWLKPEVAVVTLIVATALLRTWALAVTGLGFGESYHFSCAIRPSLSYFDHPPLAVMLAHLSMKLFGSTGPLVVRLPFILLFAGTTWLTFVIARRFFGAWAGFLAATVLNLSPVFTLSAAGFLQSDGPLMFFWMLAVYCLTRILFDDVKHPTLWWLATGIALGLAMLSKYHAVFIVAGAVLFVLTMKDQRRWLLHPGPYLALALAAAFSTPVVYWNYQHQWISFLWQGNRGLESHGLRLDWLFRCLGGQALWLLPWIWVPLLLELVRCFRAGRSDQERWFIGCMAVTPIALFTAVSAHASIGFHFHWQAPGYLLLFIPLGASLARRLSEGSIAWRRWLVASTAISFVALVVITSHASTGWWSRLGPQWLSAQFGEPDDPTLECLDYSTLASGLAERGLLNKPDVFLFTNRWFQSGKVDWALNGAMPVMCFHHDPRSWAFFDQPADWLGKDGILVSTKKFLGNPNEVYGEHFRSIEALGTVEVPRGGLVAETLNLYYCRELIKPYPLPYHR